MLSLEQLNMLVIAAETGSFSACGRKLGKGQSAISQGIANLELDLNVQLFDRSGRTPILTADGERVLRHAKALLMQAGEIEKLAAAIESKHEARIRILLDDSVCQRHFFCLIREFEQEFPHIKLEISTQPSPDICPYIEQGRGDLGVVFSDFGLSHQVDLCLIGNMNFIPVCHPLHPLAGIDEVGVHNVLPFRQLLLRGVGEQTLTQITPLSSEIWWMGSFSLMKEVIMAQCGWGYLPEHMVEASIDEGHLHRMPVLLDHKPWNLTVDMVWQKGQVDGPGMTWLKQKFKQFLGPI